MNDEKNTLSIEDLKRSKYAPKYCIIYHYICNKYGIGIAKCKEDGKYKCIAKHKEVICFVELYNLKDNTIYYPIGHTLIINVKRKEGVIFSIKTINIISIYLLRKLEEIANKSLLELFIDIVNEEDKEIIDYLREIVKNYINVCGVYDKEAIYYLVDELKDLDLDWLSSNEEEVKRIWKAIGKYIIDYIM